MPQQSVVSRTLKFQGIADYTDNIAGNPSCEKVVLYDDFNGPVLDETNDWLCNDDHGGTSAISSTTGGAVLLTASAGTQYNKDEIASTLNWYAREACVMEARVQVDAITIVSINVGWADAAEYSDNQVCFEIDTDTLTDRCTDGACFVFDTDADNDYWHICNSLAGSEAFTSLGIAPVADTWETFRVALNTDGDATFYRNGVAVGFKALAVTTTADLTPYVSVMAQDTTARALLVDYIKCWQNRSANDVLA